MCPDGEGEWVVAGCAGCDGVRLQLSHSSAQRWTHDRRMGCRTYGQSFCLQLQCKKRSWRPLPSSPAQFSLVLPPAAWLSVRPFTGLSVCSFASRLPVSSSMLTNKSDDNKLKGSDCCDWPGNIKGMPPLLCARHGEAFVWLLDSTKCPANGCPSVSRSVSRLVVWPPYVKQHKY